MVQTFKLGQSSVAALYSPKHNTTTTDDTDGFGVIEVADKTLQVTDSALTMADAVTTTVGKGVVLTEKLLDKADRKKVDKNLVQSAGLIKPAKPIKSTGTVDDKTVDATKSIRKRQMPATMSRVAGIKIKGVRLNPNKRILKRTPRIGIMRHIRKEGRWAQSTNIMLKAPAPIIAPIIAPTNPTPKGFYKPTTPSALLKSEPVRLAPFRNKRHKASPRVLSVILVGKGTIKHKGDGGNVVEEKGDNTGDSAKSAAKSKARKKLAAAIALGSIKLVLRGTRKAAEVSAVTVSKSAESVMDKDGRAAITPVKSMVTLGGGLMRPRSLPKKTFKAAGDTFKSSLTDDAKTALAPISKGANITGKSAKAGVKGARVTKKVVKTTAKGVRTAKRTIKTAKRTKTTIKVARRGFKVTLSMAKGTIKGTKLAKVAAKLAISVAKGAIKLAKIVAKAAVTIGKLAVKAVAALAGILSAKFIGIALLVILGVAVVVLAVVAIVSWFTPNTDSETIVGYAQLVRQLDDSVGAIISERAEGVDYVVFTDQEYIRTDLLKFFAIFTVWQDQRWDDMEYYIKELHQAMFSLSFTEFVFYVEVTTEHIGIDEYGEEYTYETTELVQRIRLYVTLTQNSITQIGQNLGMNNADIAWLYEVFNNQNILDQFPEIEDFLMLSNILHHAHLHTPHPAGLLLLT